MKKVAVIGLGTMGSAIHKSLQGDFDAIGIDRQSDNLADVAKVEVVIIAVKPQSFAKLTQALRPHIGEQIVISIMAGISIRSISAALGARRIVRTMPNLALATGQSLTAWYTEIRGMELSIVEAILELWGSNLKLEDEKQFDPFTALAGSGPAYFFELASLLGQAAVARGFTAEQARQISLQTFRGAASVLKSDDSAKDWVNRVASKGGATEVALKELEAYGLGRAIDAAVEAACRRSRELSKV